MMVKIKCGVKHCLYNVAGACSKSEIFIEAQKCLNFEESGR